MAQITDYSSLVDEVAARMGLTGTITPANSELLVQVAQERLYRDVSNGGGFIGEELEATGSVSTQTFALPSQFVAPRGLFLNAPYETELDNVPIQVVEQFGSDTGVPRFFSVYGNSVHLAPIPSVSVGYRFLYSAKPATLSLSTTTNWFTTNAIEALFASVLLEASDARRDDAAIQRYALAYERAKDALIKANSRNRFGRTPPKMATDWTLGRPFNILTGS